MRFEFDSFNRYEIPVLTLANPNFEELHVIKTPKDLKASIRFNAVSEMSFYVDKTSETEYYFDMLTKKRLIHVEGFGWFAILNAEMTSTGRTPRKQVNCVSYEVVLTSRLVDLAAGTYIFYNPATYEDTLLYNLMKNNLTWSIGYVSPSLYGKARTFDMPDTNIYSFLTSDVAEAYECVFVFDNETMTINAYTVDELVKDSGIMMRFDTIMKDISIRETRDKIVTALSVYGASDFSIAHVNPLGTATIYDFSSYKDMMSSDLWDAIQSWQAEVDVQTIPYATLLTQLKERNTELLTLRSDLAKAEAIRDSARQVQDVQTPYTLQASSNSATSQMSAWVNSVSVTTLREYVKAANAYPAISFNSPPSEISGYVSGVATADRGISEALINLWASERVIVQINSEISMYENQIEGLRNEMTQINTSLSLTNNFTLEQRKELEKYIFGSEYTNEYCVITGSMSYLDIQEIALDLLEQGKSILSRISQPTYEFELNAMNYLFNEKYKGFINNTALGHLVHAEISEDEWVNPILLEISISWSQPDDFSMTFGNRYKLQSDDYTWTDLNDGINKVSSAVSSEFSKLVEPVRDGTMDEVSALLTSAWDASKNAVIAGDNQAIVVDGHGLIGRKALLDSDGNPTGFYDPQQFRMINNLLCFTDDNWQNVKTALGRIHLGNNAYAYGLAAEVIIGTLVAGNYFTFTNESGSFRFDGNGASLTNASFSVTSNNNLARVYIDPVNGFRVQTRTSTSQAFVDQLHIDTSGNLVMSGLITASGGTIGGWSIVPGGLSYGSNAIYLGPVPIVASINGHGTQSLVFKAGNNFGVGSDGTLYARDARFSSGTFDGGSFFSVNATGGTFSNITANGGFFSNITANGGTFSNITASGNISANTITANATITSPNINGGIITSSQFVGINGTFTNLSASNGNVQFNSNYISINGIQVGYVPNYSDVCIVPPYNGTGNVGTGPQSGTPRAWDMVYANRLYGTVYSTSMRKTKKNINAYKSESERFDLLEPITFVAKDDVEQTIQLGLIAEDVKQIYPELVFEPTPEEGAEPYMAMCYDRISVVLIDELQKARKRITKLEEKVDRLEAMVEKLVKNEH